MRLCENRGTIDEILFQSQNILFFFMNIDNLLCHSMYLSCFSVVITYYITYEFSD